MMFNPLMQVIPIWDAFTDSGKMPHLRRFIATSARARAVHAEPEGGLGGQSKQIKRNRGAFLMRLWELLAEQAVIQI
ncbi:MAG: hypothetical protein AOY29_03925 [Alcanivorax borkumensis]|jgi:hypothetical protein|nr:MAG: hypothetical protein AOY29_03925 [Alcanivorax borkumensis]